METGSGAEAGVEIDRVGNVIGVGARGEERRVAAVAVMGVIAADRGRTAAGSSAADSSTARR